MVRLSLSANRKRKTKLWLPGDVAPGPGTATYSGTAYTPFSAATEPPHSIAIPAANTGDLRVFTTLGHNGTSTTTDPPALTGWRSVAGALAASGSGVEDAVIKLRVKQAGDTDANVAVNLADGGVGKRFQGGVEAVRFTLTAALDVNNVVVGFTQVGWTPADPGAITVAALSRVFAILHISGSTALVAAPTGWTLRVDSYNGVSPFHRLAVYECNTDQAAGSFNPPAFPISTVGGDMPYAVWVLAIPL